MMIPSKNYLIISALGAHRPEIIHEITRACTHCGCNILNTKMNIMGADVAILLYLSGSWGAVAKMEAILPSLEQKLGLSLLGYRTHEQPCQGKYMSYSIQISAIDKTGILKGLSEFLYRAEISIEEISGNTFLNATNTRMVSLTLRVHIPNTVHLASFREHFLSYCDEKNLDAFLEPLRTI